MAYSETHKRDCGCVLESDGSSFKFTQCDKAIGDCEINEAIWDIDGAWAKVLEAFRGY